MYGGKNRKRASFGYTIVEVMLFLAISGFMFVTAAVFINGKQANAQFRQGMNDANTQIRTVMNDVINGYYPSNSDFECTVSGSGTPQIDKLKSITQGTNMGCAFIGKAIQFMVRNTGNSSDGWSGYNVYSIAGRQYASTDPTCTPAATSASSTPGTFCQAKPVAVDNGSVSVTEKKTFQWGVTVKKVCSLPTPTSNCVSTTANSGAIGFFGAFGKSDSSGTLQSGSQTVDVALIPNSTFNDIDEITHIQSLASTGSFLDSPDILICFQDGRGKTAGLTIGGTNGQQTATSIQIGDSRC